MDDSTQGARPEYFGPAAGQAIAPLHCTAIRFRVMTLA